LDLETLIAVKEEVGSRPRTPLTHRMLL